MAWAAPCAMDIARQLAIDELQREPLLIVASNQTAGRGRAANTWWSGQGSLTFSVVFNERHVAIPEMISIALALAVGGAIKDSAGVNPNYKGQLKGHL